MSSTVGVIRLNGYRRDERGIWRYELTSKTVPGARDVTIGEYWRFRPETDGDVHIPLLCIELSATLDWARHAEQAPRRALWRGLSLPLNVGPTGRRRRISPGREDLSNLINIRMHT